MRLSSELKALRRHLITGFQPEDLPPSDNPEIARELNEYRRVLGRMVAVQQSQGRHEGWADVSAPTVPKDAIAYKEPEIPDDEIPSDDDEEEERGPGEGGKPPTKSATRRVRQ